jgi:hypothetical protein
MSVLSNRSVDPPRDRGRLPESFPALHDHRIDHRNRKSSARVPARASFYNLETMRAGPRALLA